MSRNPHKPTDDLRKKVSGMYGVGIPQEDIARFLGVDEKTLRKYYREELDTSLIKANAAIGGALYSKAKAGDTSAIIWWEKTRAGKSDQSTIDNKSSDGSMTPPSKIIIEHVDVDKK